MGYCTLSDVYTLALSAQAFVTLPRPFEAADTTTGVIRLTAHGLTSTDIVTLVNTDGGSLPTGLSSFTTYSPDVLSSSLFRLTGHVSYASVGYGWAVQVDPVRRIQAHIEQESSVIDEHLTAETLPLATPFPPVLVGLAARMAARAAVLSLAVENAEYRVAVDRLFEREATDRAMLQTWLKGKPIQPRPVDATPSVPENAPVTSYLSTLPGWVQDSL